MTMTNFAALPTASNRLITALFSDAMGLEQSTPEHTNILVCMDLDAARTVRDAIEADLITNPDTSEDGTGLFARILNVLRPLIDAEVARFAMWAALEAAKTPADHAAERARYEAAMAEPDEDYNDEFETADDGWMWASYF